MLRAPVNIIVAEDDEDDYKIIRETLKGLLPGNGLTWVKDGAEPDITAAYDLGVNSFIGKSERYDQFVEVIKGIEKYWIETVEVPDGRVTKSALAPEAPVP